VLLYGEGVNNNRKKFVVENPKNTISVHQFCREKNSLREGGR
jgi:hypothetical protein